MRIVVALGGNALLHRGQALSAENQRLNVKTAVTALAPIVFERQLVITHGNGPQVGMILLRVEETRERIPAEPLDVLVAETQGSIGYRLTRSLHNAFHTSSEADDPPEITSILTQVVVDRDDPSFDEPTKPVGPCLLMQQRALLPWYCF